MINNFLLKNKIMTKESKNLEKLIDDCIEISTFLHSSFNQSEIDSHVHEFITKIENIRTYIVNNLNKQL
tara:strand:+ start:439 stop:645 length:207 start_codon:yes stop_codon:yes gene_type:complete